ncbi:MAG: hypothetical protein ABW228_03750 [Thermoleophilaceae bacterium]
MHSSQELSSSMFQIAAEGRRVRLEELFEGFGEQDRLGVVVNRPCGAVGASALISATVTAFYDIQRARGPDFFVYPDYYLFHIGRALGDHGMLDVFPSRKEVVVPEEPDAILDAVNDRAITRLLVPSPDGALVAPTEPAAPAEGSARPSPTETAARTELAEPAFDRVALASARRRIATCLAYSPSGRVTGGDVRIASNPVVEGYVESILAPESHVAALRAGDGRDRAYADSIEARSGEVAPELRAQIREARRELIEEDRPVETYGRITLEEALQSLVGRVPAAASPAG